jgi:hypothetical protein
MRVESDWDHLLSLDGATFVIDERLGYWVKFDARRTGASPAAPQGVSYSLSLHHRSGTRILGFDNAHQVQKGKPFDHWHRDADDPGRGYEFVSPERLLADFWQQVDRVLKEHQDD